MGDHKSSPPLALLPSSGQGGMLPEGMCLLPAASCWRGICGQTGACQRDGDTALEKEQGKGPGCGTALFPSLPLLPHLASLGGSSSNSQRVLLIPRSLTVLCDRT